jgi:hypothetical protein
MTFVLSPETLSMLAGVLLTLAFSYIPGLNVWYQTLTATWKSLLMLGLLIVVSAGAFGLSCAGWIDGLACTQVDLKSLVWCLVLAIIANQSVYKLSPPTSAVMAAKAPDKPQ